MTEPVDLMIRNATIVTIDPERRVITDGALVIEHDRIKDIGKSDKLTALYRATKVIDGSDKLVMPGIVNAHLHFEHQMHKGLAPDNLKGIDWERLALGRIGAVLTKEDEVWGGMAALIETLKSGATTVLQFGANFPEDSIEAVADLGMRVMTGMRVYDQVVMGHSTKMKTTDECLRANEAFVDKYKDGLADGRIKPVVNIVGSGRCTDRLLTESKKIADRHGVLLMLNCASTCEQVLDNLKRTGMRPVEHLDRIGVLGQNVVLVHMVYVNDQEIQMLKQNHAHVAHCPSAALKLGKGMSKVGRFPEMLDAGVNVALGSDASDCSNYHDMVRIMYLAAVLFKDFRIDPTVMGAETAIEMATLNGARALGLEDQIGSLEKGKKADVIVIDMKGVEWVPVYNPIQSLIYSSSGNSVQTVIIDGRIVMEDRQILTVNEEEVLAKCKALSKGILERSGVNGMTTFRWKLV